MRAVYSQANDSFHLKTRVPSRPHRLELSVDEVKAASECVLDVLGR